MVSEICAIAAMTDALGNMVNFSADGVAHNIMTGWLAHAADDWSIRSGVLSTPEPVAGGIKEATSTAAFSPEIRRRPRALFRAFYYIDVPAHENVSLLFDASWDEKEVKGKFSSWNGTSRFFCVKGSYVAVL